MRDIHAGRDIVDCTITEIVGDHPTVKILQQGGVELAKAEQRSRQIVSHQRKKRLARASLFALLALAIWGISAGLGYYWLLHQGHLTMADLIHDTSNVSIAAFVSVAVTALVGVGFGIASYAQKDPTPAESLNTARLRTINVRWDELRGLGLSNKDIKKIRKNQLGSDQNYGQP